MTRVLPPVRPPPGHSVTAGCGVPPRAFTNFLSGSTTIATGIVWDVGIGVNHAMWGRVNWWNRRVHIGVSRHTRIHVGNRIERRDREARWSHNPTTAGVQVRDEVSCVE